MAIENGCTVPDSTPIVGTTKSRLMECNAKAMYAIQGDLIRSEFVKVMHCTSAKEIWDKMKNVYEGMEKSKGQSFKPIEGNSNT